jgi:hypothetical protein
MFDLAVFKPAFAMIALTFMVWLRLYQTRLGEMNNKRIHPQKVALSKEMNLLEDSRAADNFRNLFELPVLFYLALIVAAAFGMVSPVFLFLAWTFVALRFLHSYIHCSYNRVKDRFTAYLLSSLSLWAMWIYLAFHLLWK